MIINLLLALDWLPETTTNLGLRILARMDVTRGE